MKFLNIANNTIVRVVSMEVLSEQTITNAEAKELLEQRGKMSELKYEQKNALTTLKKFAKLDAENAKKMVAELKNIGKLRDKPIIEIVNTLPQDKDDLKTILQKEYSLFSQEELDKILEVVEKNS